MHPSWLAYLPPHLAAALLAHPDTSPLDCVLRQQAVALFADISGFTRMSDALGRCGIAGTEELSQILNRTFGTIIAIIERYGGSIGTFAGDALTVVFPITARTRTVTARRAIQCAIEMQAALAAAPTVPTSGGDFHLTMKIGLAQGSVASTSVGDASLRLTYLIMGSAIDRSTLAEAQATPGTVVVTDDLLQLAGGLDQLPCAPGFSQVRRLQRCPRPARRVELPPPDYAVVATIARYLPAVIAHRFAHGLHGFVDEHRVVTTLFVRFSNNTSPLPSVDVRWIQAYLCAVVQILDRYDGHLRQVDAGDKGSLFIALFGAPTAHEDDAERALLAALEIRAHAHAHAIHTAMGITTDHIYCGLVGSPTRREYAAIGDAVNLAARLMSAAAWDQILVDTTTRQRTSVLFAWHDLAPIQVKGKAAAIPIAALERRQRRTATRLHAPGYTLPMVGRQAALAHCRHVLEQVQRGQSQLLGITGEAGMGKTRLVAEVMRTAAREGLAYFASECLSYGTHTSYLVWQNLLRGLFDLPATLDATEQSARLQAALIAIDPQWHDRLPLFGPILNLDIPDSVLTRSLDAQQRKAALEGVLVDCIRHWARAQPLLLVFDDCHWIDPLSDDLLLVVGQRCSDVPLLLLATYRPLAGEYRRRSGDTLKIRTLMHYCELHLQEFSQAETAQLIGLKLARWFGETTQVPPSLLDQVSERAQGNPFYIDELLNLLHDRGIDLRDSAGLANLELPDSLQRLILSRIDRLEEGPKVTLKLASIIGRLFKANWLWQIYTQLGDAAQVSGYLSTIQQFDLAQLDRSDPELEYLFKHLLTREVAYESLALRTRMALHEQVGFFIEQTYQYELHRWLDALAYHYGHSANTAKQREYFQRAGEAAQAAYANESAIAYYERLLPLLAPAEQIPIYLALSELQECIGLYDQSGRNAHAARVAAEPLGDLHLLARCWQRDGLLAIETSDFAVALPQLERALDAFRRSGDQHAACKTLGRIGNIYFMQGRYDELLTLSEQQLALATVIDDQREICQAFINSGSTHLSQGRYQAALAAYERGSPIALASNLLREQYLIHASVGIVHHFLGNYHQAFTSYLAGAEAVTRIGFRAGISVCLANLGCAYGMNGQYAEASACLHWCIRYGLEQADRRALAWTIGHLGCLASDQGELERALRLLDASVALYRTIEALVLQGDYQHQRAIILYQLGDLDAAEADNDHALRIAQQHNTPNELLQAQVLRIRLHVACGQRTLADALTELAQLPQDTPQAQALVAYTMWQLAPHEQRYRDLAAERYWALYEQAPNRQDGRRYTELTGELLPPLAPLPAPPAIVSGALLDLDTLLTRVAHLLERHAQGQQ